MVVWWLSATSSHREARNTFTYASAIGLYAREPLAQESNHVFRQYRRVVILWLVTRQEPASIHDLKWKYDHACDRNREQTGVIPRRQLANQLVDGQKQLIKRCGSQFLQALPVAVQLHPLHQAD
jgi:hypothetical protein